MNQSCPIGGDHSARKAIKPGDEPEGRVTKRGTMWRIGSLTAAKDVLLARHETIQAGFTAEYIPRKVFRNHPILISDGPQHDDQRRKVARFFAPKVVAECYTDLMTTVVDKIITQAQRTGTITIDDVALYYTVEVTASIVGLTHAKVPALARRLEKFFRQPPLDRSKPRLGRTNRQWMAAAANGLGPVFGLFVFDVLPAVRSRTKRPREDVISHLIEQNYNLADILVECVTYGTAGMVTTREFIAMACWHLLDDDALRQRYLAAEEDERLAILSEIIRLEPPVGHLYRRVTADVTVVDRGTEYALQPGDLVDLDIRQTNADPDAFPDGPLALCPARDRAQGVHDVGLSFGFGAHGCPGQPLALRETDALLHRLLALPVTKMREPTVNWDDLIEGYKVRGLTLYVTN
ncbi:cytochrome P450 [Enteractinococcus coprophilus]|uniref:Cytochrome P450 n=1 Tax=Enteractinococcus coprophilus TaxID=1027633 RepID=A0A543APE0_9MICC|nr:cytochrome P450 [Enteractinococcus coprophilus]TQL74419.1 cytochrome P450 [Enteractinococcus coprophilus]